jgi:hypothetical protein
LLHDDDFLAPDFVEAMVELAAKIPGKGLYYGHYNFVDEAGRIGHTPPAPAGPPWRSVDLVQAALRNPIRFPAELFRPDYTKALGGFRATSSFTGDWDMWIKLALHYGAGQTSRVVGNSRGHEAEGRGTTRVVRNGKFWGLTFMQAKKNAALLRRHGIAVSFDRAAELQFAPVSARSLLKNGAGFTRRILAYDVALLIQSKPPNGFYRLFQTLARCLGSGFVKTASGLCRALHPAGNSEAPHQRFR